MVAGCWGNANYYGSSDTRMHVAETTREKLIEYVTNTPEDAGRTHLCAKQRYNLVDGNMEFLDSGIISDITKINKSGKIDS